MAVSPESTNLPPSDVIIVNAPPDDTAPVTDPAIDRWGRIAEYAIGAVIVVLSSVGLIRGSIIASKPLVMALAGGYMFTRASPDTSDDVKYTEVLAVANKWGVPTSEVMEVVNRWSGNPSGNKSLYEVTVLLTNAGASQAVINEVGAAWDKKL